MKDCYAILAVDTEALRKRATQNYSKGLIWGVYEKNKAGVGEMCAASDEVSGRMVF